ncbi:hypothetical protein LXA43DRAFT_1104739 [Ganoderma leucocontextum]|nr:hypothetical protein LXA43DRAFT_1104739 [Ganoderma leucocontextum]
MPELNFDVLRRICEFVTDVPDVLHLSSTTRTVHQIAVERRLSMRAVTINSSLHDLHSYIFPIKKAPRGQYIRAIIIPESSQTPDSLDELKLLIEVFAGANGVRTLSLAVPAQPLSLFSRPEVHDAAAALTSLEELSVHGPIDVAVHLLRSTRSSLRVFRHDTGHVAYSTHRLSIDVALAPQLTSTLEEIEFNLQFFAATASTPLPSVKSVTLTNVCDLFGPGALLQLCPNLGCTLILATPSRHRVYSDSARLQTFRAESQAVASEAVTWRALDRMAGLAGVVYALGLALPIRHLTLDVEHESNPNWLQTSGIPRVQTILTDCTPTHLALVGIQLCHQGFSILDDSLFRGDVSARLTHLVLDATYRNLFALDFEPDDAEGEPGRSWDVVLDTLLRGLRPLRLTHIRIIIRCKIYLGRPRSTTTHKGARLFDFDRLLSTLPNTLPTLSHIFITSTGSATGGVWTTDEWNASRAWRVRPHDSTGTPQLEELSAKDGEAAIKEEEMQATEVRLSSP